MSNNNKNNNKPTPTPTPTPTSNLPLGLTELKSNTNSEKNNNNKNDNSPGNKNKKEDKNEIPPIISDYLLEQERKKAKKEKEELEERLRKEKEIEEQKQREKEVKEKEEQESKIWYNDAFTHKLYNNPIKFQIRVYAGDGTYNGEMISEYTFTTRNTIDGWGNILVGFKTKLEEHLESISKKGLIIKNESGLIFYPPHRITHIECGFIQ